MMIGKFLAVAILVVPIFADTDIPLKQLYQIVKYYPRVSFCNRDIVSGYWMAAGNVRHITYTGDLKPGENARKFFFYQFLSEITFNFVFQVNCATA